MKIKLTKIVLLTSVLMLNMNLIYSQITTNERPFSLTSTTANSLKYPQIVSIAPPDMKKIIAEDEINDTKPGIFTRVAVPIPVCFNSNDVGDWQTLSDGGRLWRLTLYVENAQSVDLTFDQFWLPEGGKFFIYSTDNEQIIGAITSEFLNGNSRHPANFSTGIILGDELTIEYYQPTTIKEKPIISISNVYYGYRYIQKNNEETKNLGESGDCQVNVNCSEGQNWQNEKKAVARVYVKTPTGAGWCSGSLLNNTCNNLAPLFLTADHCLDNVFDAIDNPNLSQWIFYWDYEFPGCEDLTNEPIIKSTVGATVIANNSVSDFALLELTQDPRNLANFEPYYLGWDYSGNAGTGGVGIHHPQGDVKKIATYNISPNNSDCFNSGNANFWKLNWQSTTHGWSVTEGGSSGSPLINSDRKVIGQLYGAAYCSNPNCSNPSEDIGNYGKFSVSWTGNGATDDRRRLINWLDPISSGNSTLSGISTFSISGPSLICSSGATFTVNNLPSGTTVSWDESANLTEDPQNPGTFTANGSGAGWVEATLTTGCGEITLPRKTIWAGPKASFTGPTFIAYGGTGTYTAEQSCGYYEWYLQKEGASGGILVQTGNPLTLRSVPRYGKVANIEDPVTRKPQPVGSTVYYLWVNAIAPGVGAASSTHLKITANGDVDLVPEDIMMAGMEVSQKSGIEIFPNPATGEATLTIQTPEVSEMVEANTAWELEIYTQSQLLKEKKTNLKGNSTKLQTAGWKEGVYIVRVNFNNKILTGKLVVKK